MSYGLPALRKVSLQEGGGGVRGVSAQKGSCAWVNQSCFLFYVGTT